MSFQCTALNVLFTAPGDTGDLIEAGFAAVAKWNEDNAQDKNFVLIPRHFSTGAVSLFASGSDGQSVINETLLANADVVISVFRARFGTPTPRAKSGTAEEIKGTLDSGRRLHIFFSAEPVDRNHDPKQLAAVQKFQRGMTEGLWQEFDSPTAFGDLVSRALIADVRHFADSLPARSAPTALEPSLPPVNLQIGVHGTACAVPDADDLLESWLTIETKKQREAFAEGSTKPSSTADYSIQSMLGSRKPEPIQQGQFDQRVRSWEQRVRADWPERMNYLAGSAFDALSFSILNAADSSVKNLRVDLIFEAAAGVAVVSKFKPDEMFPPLFPRKKDFDPFTVDYSQLRAINSPVTWENEDGNLVVTIELDLVRSHTPWKGGEDQVVLILRDPTLSEVPVRWRATAESFDGVIGGEMTVQVSSTSGRDLLSKVLK
ncbi:hypothetical protein RHOER0001_4880 [Rhodococcus erythropolis SK121]|nr:hypothetical protein RHOER0001_4880 [Rhodococcus erythropolis SK121]